MGRNTLARAVLVTAPTVYPYWIHGCPGCTFLEGRKVANVPVDFYLHRMGGSVVARYGPGQLDFSILSIEHWLRPPISSLHVAARTVIAAHNLAGV